jgi:hypothetical protein
MRMMMRVCIPTEAGSKAIRDGVLPKTVMSFIETAKPEGAYFTTHEGERTAYFFFDMKDNASVPMLAEPFFMNMNAKVDFLPCMNVEDLKTGIERAMK